jgi:hypothetical protein
MPPVGFEPTISAGKRPQTYGLDRAAIGTGTFYTIEQINVRAKTGVYTFCKRRKDKKSRSRLQTLVAQKLTWSEFRTENPPKILDASVQNLSQLKLDSRDLCIPWLKSSLIHWKKKFNRNRSKKTFGFRKISSLHLNWTFFSPIYFRRRLIPETELLGSTSATHFKTYCPPLGLDTVYSVLRL